MLPSLLGLRWLCIVGDLCRPIDSMDPLWKTETPLSLWTSEERRRPAVRTLLNRFRGGEGAGGEVIGRLGADAVAMEEVQQLC